MQLSTFDYQKLPFSKLFKTYVRDFEEVSSYYEVNPFDGSALNAKAAEMPEPGGRSEAASLLRSLNAPFDPDAAALRNIDRLQEPGTLAIVTGQQLGLYGGPAYTVFKILSAIALSTRLEATLGRPVVPVFWLADEDHDYDEVRSLRVLNGEGVEQFSLPPRDAETPPVPVSEMVYPPEIRAVRQQLRATLIDTDFSDSLWELLDSCFTEGASFFDGFGSFMTRLFSKHGLVLAGSNSAGIKSFSRQTLITAVQKADTLREALEIQSQQIAEDYHRQATLYDSHLFYLHPEAGRIKIHRGEGENMWRTEAGQEWSSESLVTEIEEQPERFSPDVFLRPVLQDRLLPTFGYVAGPGELAYYGQMKQFYSHFDRSMPVIFPRMSATFVEPAIERIIGELPFGLEEYHSRMEDLESGYVERTEQLDIESEFEEWHRQARSVAGEHIGALTSVDDTLEGAAEKALAAYHNELDKLKGKVYRAVKKRDQIQLGRIKRIRQNIFPERSLQERTLSTIYYMNKFGPDLWDRLLEQMGGDPPMRSHTLIKL